MSENTIVCISMYLLQIYDPWRLIVSRADVDRFFIFFTSRFPKKFST